MDEDKIFETLDTGHRYGYDGISTLRKVRPGMYLAMYNGFDSLDDWANSNVIGYSGPIIGPLSYCHTTYGSDVKMRPMGGEHCNSLSLSVVGGLLRYRGKYYGDWTVFLLLP